MDPYTPDWGKVEPCRGGQWAAHISGGDDKDKQKPGVENGGRKGMERQHLNPLLVYEKSPAGSNPDWIGLVPKISST